MLNMPWIESVSYISDAPSECFCKKSRRSIVILGSTGSIGRNALYVAERHENFFHIEGLACGRNVELLAAQAKKFRPAFLAVQTEECKESLLKLLPKGYSPDILFGKEGYSTLAALPSSDMALCCQAGGAGVAATLAAAAAGKVIALANKESMVLAGELLRFICRRTGAAILPVDSEHYAIFQCLAGKRQPVEKLVLTASGGPFRGKSKKQLEKMDAKAALRHPNWQMGKKISIDSATLMNKGLELIEASYLYGMGISSLDILIHPQSIVHSLVQFKDNSFLAQLAVPDMRLPIGACLCWPEFEMPFISRLDLAETAALTFEKPDEDVFSCLMLAKKALQWQPNSKTARLNPALIVLNAANEAAVNLFLQNNCAFCDIPAIIEKCLEGLVWHSHFDYPDENLPFQNYIQKSLEFIERLTKRTESMALQPGFIKDIQKNLLI